jgi:hypothetical protein
LQQPWIVSRRRLPNVAPCRQRVGSGWRRRKGNAGQTNGKRRWLRQRRRDQRAVLNCRQRIEQRYRMDRRFRLRCVSSSIRDYAPLRDQRKRRRGRQVPTWLNGKRRWHPLKVPGLLVIALLVLVNTVYGRYHYSADGLAGLGVSLLALCVVIAGRSRSRRRG